MLQAELACGNLPQGLLLYALCGKSGNAKFGRNLVAVSQDLASMPKQGRHCMMVSACIIFDIAIYPLMIWFLFIDIPEFLRYLVSSYSNC